MKLKVTFTIELPKYNGLSLKFKKAGERIIIDQEDEEDYLETS